MFALHAHGVGDGIAIGTARIIRRSAPQIGEFSLEPSQIENEVARYRTAVQNAQSALKQIRAQLPPDTPQAMAAFLGIHLMMLEDPDILEQPIAIIRARKINAEAALHAHAASLDDFFQRLGAPHLRSKSTDVAQVITRIQDELAASSSAKTPPQSITQALGEQSALDTIIVANDLSPADALELRNHPIGGFITNLGSPISHTAILARSLGLPAIVGLHDAIRYLRNGDILVVDGMRGVVLVEPDQAVLEAYTLRREKIHRRQQALEVLRDAEPVTLDGEAVALYANIKFPEEASAPSVRASAGVGLYRTEFLFMERTAPADEHEQFDAYASAAEHARGGITIRTLDFGADKPDDEPPNNAATRNPALGRRAIRLCLHDLHLFKPQLRALYRASARANLRIMLPMISGLEELQKVRALLSEVRDELRREKLEFDPNTPVGAMIEVPAAAVIADHLAAQLDFLSIGTNDLIQYTLAIDRVDNQVSDLYDPLHPAVLRLIKNVIDAAKNADIPLSMCGEMAGNTAYTHLLLGLGLREFSMEPNALLAVKQQIRLTNTQRIAPQIAEILRAHEPERIRELVTSINK